MRDDGTGHDPSDIPEREARPFSLLERLQSDPLGLIKRALYKTFWGRWKYGQGDDYDASRYWGDRFRKYGMSLRGPGDEGLSEDQNEEMYQEAGEAFREFCQQEGIDFHGKHVLEVGCGTGFYTRLVCEQEPASYTGLDITDALFEAHRERFPQAHFIQQDVCEHPIEGEFDVVLMIDVIQHIVKEDKLRAAMGHIRDSLKPGGRFVITPLNEGSQKRLFYVHSWTFQQIREQFPGFHCSEPAVFRESSIACLRRG